jgi:hypothetical protein
VRFVRFQEAGRFQQMTEKGAEPPPAAGSGQAAFDA